MGNNLNKIITKLTKDSKIETLKSQLSQEQLQQEYDYILAEKILKSALDNGFITSEELNKITALNRQSFSPALVKIMP